MPKIFGDTRLDGETAVCSKCRYRWKASTEQLMAFRANKLVPCPICRVTKEHNPEEPFGDNQDFVIDSKIIHYVYKQHGVKLQEIDVPIRHNTCKNIFTIKSKYLEQFIENPRCPICNRQHRVTAQSESTKPSKPVVNTNNNLNTPRDKSTDTKDLEDKAKKYKEFMDELVGKQDNNVTIISTDKANASITVQCINCGLECNISVADYIARRKNANLCPECSIKKVSLAVLNQKYLGKIYNGLRINNIYQEEKTTKCDVICMDDTIRHRFTGYRLGDVINHRVVCKECCSGSNNDASNNKKLTMLLNGGCINFKSKLPPSSVRHEPSFNRFSGITLRDFYLKYTSDSASICDICTKRDGCKDKYNKEETKFSYMRTTSDKLDDIRSMKLDIQTHCPAIYSIGMFEGASICDTDMEKGLLIFRDAYRGRDGLIYKFCKCTQHGIEMILSEKEIAAFNHSQCLQGKKSEYQRFLDISNEYLLVKKRVN